MFTPSHYITLSPYRHIYYTFKYGDRAPEFTFADEKILEKIYNEWRGTREVVSSCDECIEEAFERLMKEMIEFEKRQQTKTEA